jgi:hypothetical protein
LPVSGARLSIDSGVRHCRQQGSWMDDIRPWRAHPRHTVAPHPHVLVCTHASSHTSHSVLSGGSGFEFFGSLGIAPF